ncbi:MAG TPA: hypothetical protein VE955_07900 [Candidatus Dormibacteraeota bacterium]|jgi:hypothetical protein|nr:hypothetical protein [Candidatus Dormibacteraeota bacterium]
MATPPPYIVGLAISLLLIGAGAFVLFIAIKMFEMNLDGKKRTVLKWKYQKPRTKVVGVLALTSLILSLYLTTASMLGMSGITLPPGDLFQGYEEIPLAFGLLGLAYVLRLQYQTLKVQA